MLVNLHHPPSISSQTRDLNDELANLLSSNFPGLRKRRRPPAPPLSLFASGPGRGGGDDDIDEHNTIQGKSIGTGNNKGGSKITHDHKCGPINIEAVQQIMAAKWAVDVINNQSKPHDLKIGKYPNHVFEALEVTLNIIMKG